MSQYKCSVCGESPGSYKSKDGKDYCHHCFLTLWPNETTKVCDTCDKLYDRAGHHESSFIDNNCFSCSYWLGIAKEAETNNNIIVADGHVYVIDPNEDKPAKSRGFYGRTFTFWLKDGSILISRNVWNGSEIPERFRDKLPDNATLVAPRERPADKIFPEEAKKKAEGKCPICGGDVDISTFNDEASLREYNISGMCQSCQNKVFK